MKAYHDLVRHIIENGTDKGDRTGTGTRSVFGHQMRFDLRTGFPLLATKFTPFRLVLSELLWFLKGNPDISYLHAHDNHIWDEWVKPDGTFGPIYGKQWRSWPAPGPGDGSIDQVARLIDRLRNDPDNRRLIVSAWNVADVESGEMALPPCHVLFQFYTEPMTEQNRWAHAIAAMGLPGDTLDEIRAADKRFQAGLLDEAGVPRRYLSCQLYQRSADVFLGVPFNIASYALLTHMVGHVVNMAPKEFIWTGGDTHLYSNHFDQVRELLARDPEAHDLPQLVIKRDIEQIDDFGMDDFELTGYRHQGKIAAPVAV